MGKELTVYNDVLDRYLSRTVAEAVPPLSQEAEARLSRAMAMTFTPEDGMDFAAAVEKRDALLALA